jgi:hypothetical protein
MFFGLLAVASLTSLVNLTSVIKVVYCIAGQRLMATSIVVM